MLESGLHPPLDKYICFLKETSAQCKSIIKPTYLLAELSPS
jgi:hypothetical protein